MINALTNLYKRAFFHTIEKDALLEELEFTGKILEEVVIPTFELMARSVTNIEKKKELSFLFTYLDIKDNKGQKYLLEELVKFSKEIRTSVDKLESITQSELPDYVTDKTMTAKTAGIIGTVTNFSSLAIFLQDLSLYLIYLYTDNDMFYKAKEKSIRLLIPTFGEVYDKYRGNLKNVLKDLNKLSNTEVGNIETFKIASSKFDKKFNLPVNGFIGNPIYYVRLWITDLKISRYEYLKDKKKLVELKLMELKMKQNGENSPKLEKQIEYYEEKLSAIEYKISSYEED
jgi:hypothetical protein